MLVIFVLVEMVLNVCGEGFRLPRNILPSQYTLKIIADLGSCGNFTFDGEVWIEVRCMKKTETIILHAGEEMLINEAIEVYEDGKTDNLFLCLNRVPNIQIIELKLSKNLRERNKYHIHIQFGGEIKEDLIGYYRSSYVDKSTGETRWMTTTHFEPAEARLAFPCFDEPEYKSRFKLSIGHHVNYTAISNMPLECSEPIKGRHHWIWDHFENSVRMSTYLVAFVVSDFDYVTSPPNSDEDEVTFRIWTRRDYKSQAKYASEIGPRILNYFEEYFGIPFPLPKQDMVAVPNFAQGAMENWGLITYREEALLVDSSAVTTPTLEDIVSTIAHELAHQWFGNLVTPKWWNDIWLNEGFATFLSQLGVNAVHPEWNTMNVALYDTLDVVLKRDSQVSSHPVSANVTSVNEIVQIFDTISYFKGSFIIRMMNLFMGEEVFRQGIKNYLNKYRYSNAKQDDLWEVLTDESYKQNVLPRSLTIKKIMDTWTLQTGYPVITVTRNYKRATAKITQQRYLSSVSNETPKRDKSCWILPLTYTAEGKEDFANTKPDLWMDCRMKEIVIHELPDCKHWIIFNIQITGLFRVNYDKRNWKLIENTLNSDKYTTIALLNRVQILEDAFGLAKTGNLQYDIVLRLVKYLQRDTEYLPWAATLKNLADIHTLADTFEIIDTFNDYMKYLLSSIFSGVDNVIQNVQTEDVQKIYLQRIVMKTACLLDMGDCLEYVEDVFNKWMSVNDPDKENPIRTELRDIIYCNAIRKGGEKEWIFLWGRYKNTNIATDKYLMLKALTCSEDPTILERYLEKTLDEKHGIRKQDSWIVFGLVAENKEGFQVAKDFFYSNIKRLYDVFDVHKSDRLGKYLERIVSRMISEEDLKELQKFFSDNEEMFNVSISTKQLAVERAENNINWIKHRLSSFTDALINFLCNIKC